MPFDRKAWNIKNRERRQAASHNRYLAHTQEYKDAARKSELRRKYNLTPDEWLQLYKVHGGHCALCTRTKRLHLDHDHETGRIRGFLCPYHNTALGAFGDNKAGVLRVLAYLRGEKHQ